MFNVNRECNDQAVTSLRWRQMRNMHLALMVSQGTPMVLMGDEYGHTRTGNNNTFGHDNERNNFDWSALEAQREQYFRYHSGLVKFRLAHPLLGRAEFLNDNDITWHEDNWDNPDSLFLAYTLHDCGQGGGDLYIAFNQHDFFVDASLPPPDAVDATRTHLQRATTATEFLGRPSQVAPAGVRRRTGP